MSEADSKGRRLITETKGASILTPSLIWEVRVKRKSWLGWIHAKIDIGIGSLRSCYG
jgi:hypothetical protein